MALNKRRIAYFVLPASESELRLVAGDELVLKHPGDGSKAPFEATGTVVRPPLPQNPATRLQPHSIEL